ncbi:unnamed protein product [Cunninghamella echinulata]
MASKDSNPVVHNATDDKVEVDITNTVEEETNTEASPNMKNLTVEELYDKEKFDLSTMEPGDVFALLRTNANGLTTEEAQARIEKFGHNCIEHKEAAAIVAIALSNGDNKPPDWEDFIGIILLLLANSIIGFLEERQAGNAVKALMEF